MPTPARTSLDGIVAAGRAILERDGLAGLTMQRVADAVGVREPSLYKRVRGRSALIRLIATGVAVELSGAAEAAARTGEPRSDLAAMARALRAFAIVNPQAFALLFAPLPDEARVDPALNARTTQVLLRTVAALGGEEHALEGARLVMAWLYGFVAMELAADFRLGGEVDAAFDFGVERIVAAIAGTGASPA